MAFEVKRVEYFHVTVDGHVGQGSKLLAVFAGVGISWLAFKAVPVGSNRTRFTLFPNDRSKMVDTAKKAGLELDGPYAALIILGSDESGALADIYEKLAQQGIHVHEAAGMADIKGWYGVILYLEQADCEKAAAALEK